MKSKKDLISWNPGKKIFEVILYEHHAVMNKSDTICAVTRSTKVCSQKNKQTKISTRWTVHRIVYLPLIHPVVRILCDIGGRIKVYVTDCLVACQGLAACVLSVIMPHSTADRQEDSGGRERAEWGEIKDQYSSLPSLLMCGLSSFQISLFLFYMFI